MGGMESTSTGLYWIEPRWGCQRAFRSFGRGRGYQLPILEGSVGALQA